MEDKRVVSTQEIVCAFSPQPSIRGLPPMDLTPSKRLHKKRVYQPEQVSNCRRRPLTAAELELWRRPTCKQSPGARGVKCHVSVTCRVMECSVRWLFQQEGNILFRLSRSYDSRWLVFVFVSGTVSAPIE